MVIRYCWCTLHWQVTLAELAGETGWHVSLRLAVVLAVLAQHIHNSAWNFFLSYLFFTMLFQISRIGTTYTFLFFAHIGLKRQFSQFVKSWQKRLFCLFVVFVLEYFYSPGNWVHILKDDITCENKISVIIFTNTEPSGCCSCKNKFTEMSAI